MAQILPFPAPYPEITNPQDVGNFNDILNNLILYINTIVNGSNLPVNALLKNNNLSDVASVSASRTNLGLGSAATANTTDFDPAGAAAAVLATSLQKASNLSDLTSAATARTNLGLGSAATHAASDFDPAGAAAARAAQGINADITALVALNIKQKTANYSISPGDSLIECDASGGSFTITYAPGTVAGRVIIVKTDATYNPINISDGTNIILSLVAPAISNYCQHATVYTNGSTTRAVQ